MGIVFLHGNGGSGGGSGSLELTIVGGTTRPAKPTQNMIWINTEYEITSYVFSATQPDAPVEGMVLINISDSGRIKISSPIGKDWITVYPISVWQYVDGAWVNKTAMSYQNGEWTTLKLISYILNKDDLYQGWSVNGSLTMSAEANGLRITRNGVYGACNSNIAFDISNFDTVFLRFSGAVGPAVVQFVAHNVPYTGSNPLALINATANTPSDTLKLDLRGLKNYKKLYISVGMTGSQNGSALIESIWFE